VTRPRKIVRTAAIWMLVGVVGGLCGVAALSVFGAVERFTLDLRFHVRGRQPGSDDVVIVAFDNQTLRTLDIRPPIPRGIQARVIDRLDLAGARVIAFDYSLEQPSGNPEADRRIVQALMDARQAVVEVAAPSRDGSVAYLAGFLPFDETGVLPGDGRLQLDPDGVVRTFWRPPGRLQSFPIAAAEAFSGRRHIAVPRDALIDYRGPAGTFPQLSYIDVLDGRFPASAVRGRIAVIGSTATVLADTHHVPIDSTMSGAEIHANAMMTALEGFPLRTLSTSAAGRLAFLLGPLVAFLVITVPLAVNRLWKPGPGGVLLATPAPIGVAAVGAVAFFAWLAAAQIGFDRGTVLPVTAGCSAILTTSVASLVLAMELTRRERRRVRAQFTAVSAPIWQRVLASAGRARAVTASDIIAGYTIEYELGRGGMGVVWSAKQARLGRDVAIKVIRAEYAADGEYRRRFVAEAYRAAAITHPNVIPVIDAGESDGLLFIAMPKIIGTDLKLTIQDSGGLDASLAVQILHAIACALDYTFVHHDGLLHRDIKPSNVQLPTASPLHPYLLDFGVAMTDAEASGPRRPAGSLPYLAPERWGGGEGRAADVYALTATLYECLTGLPPFRCGSAAELRQAHQTSPRPIVTDLRPDLPAPINMVIATGMAITPTERYGTATAVTRAAAAAIGHELADDAALPLRRAAGGSAPHPDGDDLAPTDVA
jgi:CHASE2 domain-containing sensor protein